MRRTHLRYHDNIIKRLLIHAGAFNLSLILRKILGRGTPRGFQGSPNVLLLVLQMLMRLLMAVTKRQRQPRTTQPVTPREEVTPLLFPVLCLNSGAPFL